MKQTSTEKQLAQENNDQEVKDDKKKTKKSKTKKKKVKTLDSNSENQKTLKHDYLGNEERDLMQNNDELYIKSQAANTNANLVKEVIFNKSMAKK